MLKIKKETYETLQAWAQGYISALVEHSKLYQGFDEFYSYNDEWDINFHACGEDGVVSAVAHPQRMGEDGFLQTDMDTFYKLQEYDFTGKVIDTTWSGRVTTLNDEDFELEHIARLFTISKVYYPFLSPLKLFLDLIGWQRVNKNDEYTILTSVLGYLEIELVGKALCEYSANMNRAQTFLEEELLGTNRINYI